MTARSSVRARIKAVSGLFLLISAVIVARAVELTVIDASQLAALANGQHTQRLSVHAQRGTIVDRHGESLALSRESVAVYVRPTKMHAGAEPLATVARLLDQPADVVASRAGSRAPFVYLDRSVSLKQWGKIERLAIPGIGSEPGWQRIYPRGPVAGQVLGFIGIDGQGLEGVERRLVDPAVVGDGAVVVGRERFESHRRPGQPSTLSAARTPRTIASAITSAASDPSTVSAISGRVRAPVEIANS